MSTCFNIAACATGFAAGIYWVADDYEKATFYLIGWAAFWIMAQLIDMEGD